jgi:hypothetical protein
MSCAKGHGWLSHSSGGTIEVTDIHELAKNILRLIDILAHPYYMLLDVLFRC